MNCDVVEFLGNEFHATLYVHPWTLKFDYGHPATVIPYIETVVKLAVRGQIFELKFIVIDNDFHATL